MDPTEKGEKQEVPKESEEPEETTKSACSCRDRHDIWLWTGGIAFLLILIGLIFGIGHLRGWDAQSGNTHNTSATSRDRFWPEPYVDEPGVEGRYGADATGRWYYWKLPPDRVTPYTRLFMWMSYVCHQVLIWAVTYIAQYRKTTDQSGPKYSGQLSRWNWISFGLNVFFHLLHLLQTHITYDATAQDVSISSSQGSVIMLLICIILMEYRDRGLFFGWPSVYDTGTISKKLRMNYMPVNIIRRFHGYAFAWAAIYTFWYHPMENTLGHCLGFCHTWAIMLQGSLMYTHFHRNRYWRLLLESWVILHGGLVAYQTGGPEQLGTKLWPMFTFGFGLVLVLTQVFGLPFWRKIHVAFRVIPLVLYLAVTIYCYSWIPDKEGRTWVRMQEIIYIPGTYYLFFLYLWFLLFILLLIDRKLNGDQVFHSQSPFARMMYLTCSVITYVVSVGVSAAIQVLDVQMPLIVLMIILVAVFLIGVSLSSLFLQRSIPVRIRIENGGKNHTLEPTVSKEKIAENGDNGGTHF